MSIDADVVSVVPRRTGDPAAATRMLVEDGAVVVTGHPIDEAALVELLRSMFGDRLVNVGAAVEVRAAGGLDRPDLLADGHRQVTPLHSDGFGLADGAPDVVVLACAHAATDGGGASFIVDADTVHRQLPAELAEFLTTTPIDQTEPGKLPMIGPIGLRRDGMRTVWRRSFHLGPTAGDPDPATTTTRIAEWRDVLLDLTQRATRFSLVDGDVLVTDNTRTFHGRDPYTDTDRLLWRLWAWTDAAPKPLAYRGSDTSLVEAP